MDGDRYRILSSQTPVGIFVNDGAGNCTYVDERWCEITGMTVGDAMSGAWVKAVHPDDRERLRREWREAEETTQFRAEYRFVRPDGRSVWVHGSARAVYAADGSIVEHIGTIIDITDVKQLQEERDGLLARERATREELEAERQNLRAVFEQAPAAMAILRGPSLRYMLSNSVNRELLGGRDVVGKTVDAVPELQAQGFAALAEEVYRSGAPWIGKEVPVELPCTTDRPSRPAYFNGIFQPLRAGDGAVSGILAFAYEVTDLVRARQAAQLAEQRLRMVLDAAQLGSWDFYLETCALECDQRFRALCNLPAEGVVTPEAVLEAIHPDDRLRIRDAARKSFDFATGGEHAMECRIARPPGEVGTDHWVAVRGRSFFDKDGKAIRFTGTVHDITDQMCAREKLRLAEQKAASIADAVPQIVWTSDAAGTVDFYNRRWYDYTGLPSEKHDPTAWAAVLHPDELATATREWTECVAKGQLYEGELRIRRGADQRYRWHLVRCLPIRDENGEIVKWVGTSTDIDDQKRAEDNNRFLAEASALLSASLEYEETLRNLTHLAVPRLGDWCSVHVAEEGGDGELRSFVAHDDPAKGYWAENLGRRYPPSPQATRGVYSVIRTGLPELFSEVPDQMLVETARDEEHLRLMRELGIRSMMIVPLRARGRTFGALTLVAAESGRRYHEADLAAAQSLADRAAYAVDNARLFNEAREAIQVRDDFMSIASHELKTPLTPLSLYLQSITKSSGSLPEKVLGKIETMSRQVDRMERLVNRLLDISRITNHRFQVEFEEVDWSEVVKDVAGRLGAELAQARCLLVLDVSPGVVGQWDKLRIDQVVTNLLTNAMKFGAGSPIEVRLRGDSGHAILTVRDHGIGIASENQARIFGRFERAVPTQHYGGFGLGLWIVRQIVEAFAGSVSVESELGVGSMFRVDLPLGHASVAEEPGLAAHT